MPIFNATFLGSPLCSLCGVFTGRSMMRFVSANSSFPGVLLMVIPPDTEEGPLKQRLGTYCNMMHEIFGG
jgi:hypothetical protein